MEVACQARAAQLAADMHAMTLAKVCGPAPRVDGWMQGVMFYGAPGWDWRKTGATAGSLTSFPALRLLLFLSGPIDLAAIGGS